MKNAAVVLSLFLILGCRAHPWQREGSGGVVSLMVYQAHDPETKERIPTRILVNGRFIGMYTMDLCIPLSPGEHTIRAEAPGYPAVEDTICVLVGSNSQRLVLDIDG